ncbi:hypothetical protein MP638_004507 [Amoeboaphelidium occidentale]|nr:hypothetical protein MP638_004507 [Amoeboaphelidium occidentale]
MESDSKKDFENLLAPAKVEVQQRSLNAWNDLAECLRSCHRSSEASEILLKTTRMWTNAESNLNLMKASIDSMAEQMQLLQGKTSSIAEKLSLAPAVCELIKLENLTTNAVPPTPITSPVFK